MAQRKISPNVARNYALSNQNPIFSRRYRSFSQQEPANGFPQAGKLSSTQFADKTEQQNSFLENFANKFTEFLDKQTTLLSPDKPANSYPSARVTSSRQFFGEPDQENSFFKSPRDEHSMSSSKSFDDYTEDKENPARKFNVVFSVDQKPSWENSRYISSDEIIPQKSFRQTSILNEDEDKERNTIERFPNFISQQYNPALRRDRHYTVGFGVPETQRESYVLPQDLDAQTSREDDDVFGNFMKDSLETPSLGQLEWTRDNFFETNPVEVEEMVTSEDDNKQMNYPYISLQNSYIWKPTKDETVLPDNREFAADNGLQNFDEINLHRETGNNWPQAYSEMEKDVSYSIDEDNKGREYLEDKFEKGISQTGTSIYNPYTFPLNTNIWRTTQDGELPDNLDFMYRKSSQGIQQSGQPEIYPMEKNSNKFFQDEKDKYNPVPPVPIQDETHIDTDRIIRAPVVNVTPYMFPQSLLNMLNAAKYPVSTDSSITKDLPETKTNILRVNPTEKIHDRFFKDERFALDDKRNQDRTFVEDTYGAKKYNSLAFGRRPDIKDNTQNEALTKLDPDLTDEIENPPAEPTEPTPTESVEKRSRSTAKKSS